MRPLPIVKAEVQAKIPNRIWRIAVVLQINVFVFDCSPQPLDKNVVQCAASAIHADQDILGLESAGERVAGELRSLVGVEDFGMALPQRAVQRRAAESSIEAGRYLGKLLEGIPIVDTDPAAFACA